MHKADKRTDTPSARGAEAASIGRCRGWGGLSLLRSRERSRPVGSRPAERRWCRLWSCITDWGVGALIRDSRSIQPLAMSKYNSPKPPLVIWRNVGYKYYKQQSKVTDPDAKDMNGKAGK